MIGIIKRAIARWRQRRTPEYNDPVSLARGRMRNKEKKIVLVPMPGNESWVRREFLKENDEDFNPIDFSAAADFHYERGDCD